MTARQGFSGAQELDTAWDNFATHEVGRRQVRRIDSLARLLDRSRERARLSQAEAVEHCPELGIVVRVLCGGTKGVSQRGTLLHPLAGRGTHLTSA